MEGITFSAIRSPRPAMTPDEAPLHPDDLPLNRLLRQERLATRRLLASDPRFTPFASLPDGMLTFLCGEKRRLALNPETRIIHDPNGKAISGVGHHYDAPTDEYHPQCFRPFALKGYWLPLSAGSLFRLRPAPSPLLRVTATGDEELLFLVHPRSEELYEPLMEQFAHREVDVFGLALSSFRTLLVAIPQGDGQWAHTMVKVSLDQRIGGVPRLLFLKECAGSVATSGLLEQRRLPVECMKEDWSFVPAPTLLHPRHPLALSKGAGLIHRPIPECLIDPSTPPYTLPLFSLFGSGNAPFLKALVDQSGKTPTAFLDEAILKPLAEVLVAMIFREQTSLEVHGQNLLLVIQASAPHSLSIRFLYRDMGGVNILFREGEEQKLTEPLRDPGYFYSENYVKDASDILEGFANKVCFNLTKQLFKDDTLCALDPSFASWKKAMMDLGYEGNWTKPGQLGDSHEAYHTTASFFRYGYFEKRFGYHLLEEMSRQGIFLDLADTRPDLSYRHFAERLFDSPHGYNACLEVEWFRELGLKTLQTLNPRIGNNPFSMLS